MSNEMYDLHIMKLATMLNIVQLDLSSQEIDYMGRDISSLAQNVLKVRYAA